MTNLIVGQSGGPTAVINASLAGVIEEAQRSSEITGILGMRRGIEGLLNRDTVDLTAVSADQLDLLARTPGAALGSCRHRLAPAETDAVLDILESLKVETFCYIGGNDSADTSNRLAEQAAERGLGLRAIAIPKTIDNDLPETDFCPGYPSVARYVATAVAESTLDTRSLPTDYPVKIIEVMGRDAGWLAAAGGLAKRDDDDGPHLIYVPELPFDRDEFLGSVRRIHSQLGAVVVVAAETITDREGRAVGPEVDSVDKFGHPIVRGAGDALARMVKSELGLTARVDKPGTLQRSSFHTQSPVDIAVARETGREAVRVATMGRSGVMVTIQRQQSDPYVATMSSVPISRIANNVRHLPRAYMDESGRGITDAFRAYVLPLLGPDPIPEYVRL